MLEDLRMKTLGGVVIARRRFRWTLDGREGWVRVEIHLPARRKNGYGCEYVVQWRRRETRNVAVGVDEIQALVHALELVGCEIGRIERQGAQLRWLDARWVSYGFPEVGAGSPVSKPGVEDEDEDEDEDPKKAKKAKKG